MNNLRKGKVIKAFWFDSDLQYKQFIESIEMGDRDLTLDILYKLYQDGSLE